MNKRVIWIIIGLMSVGLLGTTLIQIYWFKSAINLQESRFDADVFDALNAVERKLRDEDQKIGMLSGSLGKSAPMFVHEEFAQFLKESETYSDKVLENFDSLQDSLLRSEQFKTLISPLDGWRKRRAATELLLDDRRKNPPPIENRIDPKFLTKVLHKELKNRGINLYFISGVFSISSKNFVILNGNYVVDFAETESTTVETQVDDHKNLFKSPYQIDLFTKDMKGSPGVLKIFFPNKSSWLWASLIPTLVATVLFTMLILFCFTYTVYVIFRQKKVSEMKNDFINNMTHEFKTPIATISLAADSIESPMIISSKDKIQRFIQIIKQENKRMLNQVEKVLQMALIDKKDFDLKLSSVDMHSVIEQAIQNTNLQVEKRGGSIHRELDASNPVIEGDATHLSNVIYNLLDNANKYSPEKPEISVFTRNVSNGIEVIIEDKGIGMTKEARKQIFDKFYRVPTGNLHDVKGFGLGLSYVKAITDAHNGDISVKSDLGKGSSFILFFPFSIQKPNAA